MHLLDFLDKHEVDSLDRLRALLRPRRDGRYGAFTLSAGKGTFPQIHLFVDGGQSCLFLLRDADDGGLHSVGSDPTNYADHVEFLIWNRQEDSHPRAWVMPTADGVAAVEEFFRTGALPTAVQWSDQ